MLELEDALRRVLAAVPSPAGEQIALSEAFGRVLLEPVRSPINLPPFDNSAMDGYAVRAADVASATLSNPARLQILGKIAAGDTFSGELSPGTAVRLFTGSPLPRGADAVVMQEDTRSDPADPGAIQVLDRADKGENVRFHGEDIACGQVLASAGQRLGFGQLSLLSAAGVSHAKVGRRPRVAILATGSELKEPGTPLASGQIYESNRVALQALIDRAGGLPFLLPLVTDSLRETSDAFAEAFDRYDAIVTSGGASVGELDFVKQACQAAGGELGFWKVSMKPGRPFIFGSRGDKLMFGLPGNPVSAIVTFLLLVRPALLRWQGAADISPSICPGVLAEPIANPGNRRHFVRVHMDPDGTVRSTGKQASHVLSSLAAANGLIDVPPEVHLPAGATVRVIRWDY